MTGMKAILSFLGKIPITMIVAAGALVWITPHNRLQTSRDIVCRVARWHVADVIRAGEQNDDFGIDSIQLAVLQTP